VGRSLGMSVVFAITSSNECDGEGFINEISDFGFGRMVYIFQVVVFKIV
jgi:hypothetical protein